MRIGVRIILFWSVIGGLGWVGCTRKVAGEPTRPTAAVPVAPDSLLTPPAARVRLASLQRTPCFGTCPVFLVEVWSDGQVTWRGQRHVTRLGAYTAQAPVDWVSALLREGEQNGFFDLGRHYPTNGRLVPDLPQTITMLRRGDQEYVVTDNADAPPNLLRLERYWEEKLETLVWKPVEK